MKISYSILTHNEDDSLMKLLEFLVKYKDEEDEIVILDDFSDNPKTIEILDIMTSMHEMTFEQRHLLKDYAGQKNFLTRMCKNDYIVNDILGVKKTAYDILAKSFKINKQYRTYDFLQAAKSAVFLEPIRVFTDED